MVAAHTSVPMGTVAVQPSPRSRRREHHVPRSLPRVIALNQRHDTEMAHQRGLTQVQWDTLKNF